MKRTIKHDGETAILVGEDVDPPISEVRKQIRIELGVHIRSVRDIKNVIADEGEIYEIRCLEKALKLLPKK